MAFVLAIVLLMTLQTRFNFREHPAFALFTPMLRFIEVVTDGLCAPVQDHLFLVGVKEENRKLRLEKETFEHERIGFGDIQAENRRLRMLLELKSRTACRVTSAEVIARDPEIRIHSITLDKGTNDGVVQNMAAVGSSGVVGRIYAVSSGASKVLLVTDVKSSVAVRLARSREQVLMDGTGNGLCTLRFVHRDTPVEPGEMVVTSGLDGVFPDGIPVGKVKAVRQLETGIFQEVDVELAEPLGRIEEALIVLAGRTCSDGYVSE